MICGWRTEATGRLVFSGISVEIDGTSAFGVVITLVCTDVRGGATFTGGTDR